MNENNKTAFVDSAAVDAIAAEVNAKYATKTEVDKKIAEAELGGTALRAITKEEIHDIFAKYDSETE